MKAGDLNRRIRVERPVASTDLDGAGSGSWELVVDDVPANVQDMLPSRGERIAEGVSVSNHPSRVRIRPRAGITPEMRFIIKARRPWEADRTVQIIAGPATLNSGGMEFMVEEYRPTGNFA